MGIPAGASAGFAAGKLALGGTLAIAAGAAMGAGRGRGGGRRGVGAGGRGSIGGGAPSLPRTQRRERDFSPTFIIGVNSENLTNEVITVSRRREGEHGSEYLNVVQG